MVYDFIGKTVAVVGIARSGMAAAEVLTSRGAKVTIYDSKPASAIGDQLSWAAERGIWVVDSANSIDGEEIAVLSPGVPAGSPIVDSINSSGVEIWGEIEAAYRIATAPILAVTGTNGKTTTALLLAEMLRAGGVTTFAAGNIAAGSLAQPLITAADLAGPRDAIVAEISSFQLETIKAFRPAVAAILNITPDHQDRQDWDSYVSAKWRIFENQGEKDTAVLSSSVPLPKEAVHLPESVKYFDKTSRPAWIDDLLIPGEHNRLNAMAASVMASSFGISKAAIKNAALSFKGVVHRLEYVDEINGVTYINNSMCTNNAAFASSLEALIGSKVVIAGGVFKGGDLSEIANAVSNNDVKLLVLFGRSAVEIADAVKSHSSVKTVVLDDMTQAASLASTSASPGDIVVLNPGCASFDQFKDFEDRGEQFKKFVNWQRKVTSN